MGSLMQGSDGVPGFIDIPVKGVKQVLDKGLVLMLDGDHEHGVALG